MGKNAFLSFFLVIFLLFVALAYKNQENLYAILANHYYKKNNIIEAQKYFEKSFSLGWKNINDRELYVNSLINSPFTIDGQKRLLNFIELGVDDSANSKAEYFFYNIKREIHKIYSDNYINQAPYNQKIVRWSKKPITYCFKNNENINGEVPKYFNDEITKAFIEWEKATDHELIFSEETENPNIIIEFLNHNPVEDDAQRYIVAYTTPQTVDNELQNMIIKFYTSDNNGEVFSPNQVYNTALHEIVHALGFMGHSNNKNHIMYLSKDTTSVLNDSREVLTRADINTVKLLYRIKPDITNSLKDNSDYIPYLVLGDEEEINNTKINAANDYIRKAPNLPNGYIDLAEAYVAIKDYSMAIKSLEKALLLADTYEIKSMVYYNLAVAYFYIEHYDLAMDYLQKSIAISNSEEQQYLLAEIYTKQKNMQAAKEEYRKLIKQNPDNINYAISLANIFVIEKEYKKARKVIKNYVKNNPQDKNNSRLDPYGVLRIFL